MYLYYNKHLYGQLYRELEVIGQFSNSLANSSLSPILIVIAIFLCGNISSVSIVDEGRKDANWLAKSVAVFFAGPV